MPKVGRNDPCPCGSGKKYKQCHLPIEEAERAAGLRLRRAVDTLMPRLIDAARERPEDVAAGLVRYWDGKYAPDQLGELDEHEDRGADRFLTWFAFDYRLADGRTLVEQLAADPAALALDEAEAQLLPAWAPARLRAYAVESVAKGQGMQLREMFSGETVEVEDHAASRRLMPGEVFVGHLAPAAGRSYLVGAGAHLTEDTREKLAEFIGLHAEAFARDGRPGAGPAELLAERSELLNHFVMQLPVEKPDPTLLDKILLQTRVALQLTGESLGISSSPKGDGEDADGDKVTG